MRMQRKATIITVVLVTLDDAESQNSEGKIMDAVFMATHAYFMHSLFILKLPP
jgi:hypothetical protein